MNASDGVAVECQHPDAAPNQSWMPSTLLRPEEKFSETIEFKFSTK